MDALLWTHGFIMSMLTTEISVLSSGLYHTQAFENFFVKVQVSGAWKKKQEHKGKEHKAMIVHGVLIKCKIYDTHSL